ncbi:hypothetical protein C8R32_1381 [Nitrosospira sp. Nsp5]|uniref:Uncharacterized protein n=1 Tax=Nitrosospira multiformis TaxID=1231 RepID=A0ABY0TII0_9PROT|nr:MULTISPECIES: hypothetical protein [Nitrosospira]PTR05021.1 hypothetical protein C8R32_1381 [Nitrosospira sp. Nsp5]SDQ89087.1 hypothetical protein SAMN05216402_2707 [Nitrosospira multiformis]
MAIPLKAQDAASAGLKKVSAEEIMKAKVIDGGVTFTSTQPDSICYMGPRSNGRRTIYYHADNGCDNCYSTSEGCQ